MSHGPHYLLALRFMPVFPFFLVNILAGLTRVRLTTFIRITSVGSLPGDLVYSYTGSRIDSMTSTGDISSDRILIAFILLVFFTPLTGGGRIYKKAPEAGKWDLSVVYIRRTGEALWGPA